MRTLHTVTRFQLFFLPHRLPAMLLLKHVTSVPLVADMLQMTVYDSTVSDLGFVSATARVRYRLLVYRSICTGLRDGLDSQQFYKRIAFPYSLCASLLRAVQR